jgi:hypothetical protein
MPCGPEGPVGPVGPSGPNVPNGCQRGWTSLAYTFPCNIDICYGRGKKEMPFCLAVGVFTCLLECASAVADDHVGMLLSVFLVVVPVVFTPRRLLFCIC